MEPEARFAVFARAWALAVWFGLVSQEMATSPLRIALCALTVATVAVPHPLLLTALAATYPAHWYVDAYAHDYIHTWLVAVFSTAILVGLVTTARRDAAAWREVFVEGFAPQAVVLGGAALFATGLAKLNRDFANPATSCAAVFYDYQRTVPPYAWVLPDAPWADAVAIRLTQVAETLGGLLILGPARTRRAGMLLAFGFLLLVGTNPVGRLYEFTSPFLALVLLGVSWEPVAVSPRAWHAFAAVVAGLTALGAAADAHPAWLSTRYDAGAVGFGLVALAGVVALATRGRTFPVGLGAGGLSALTWLPVLAFVAHEALPYVGLKTDHNLTMAANFRLHVEQSNHWLVPKVPRAPWNRLAVLQRSSDATLDKRGAVGWVDWRLFDYLAHHPEISVSYTLDGTPHRYARAADDPNARHNWLAHVVLAAPAPLRRGPVDCGRKRPTP